MTTERLQEIRERAERERRKIIIGERLKTCLDRDDLLAAYDALSADYAQAVRALEPFALFAGKWDAKPIQGLHDTLCSIHHGEIGAEFRLSDCKVAQSVLSTPRAQSVLAGAKEVE